MRFLKIAVTRHAETVHQERQSHQEMAFKSNAYRHQKNEDNDNYNKIRKFAVVLSEPLF
jgi:hypothetical protein